jgi:TonB family protein
MIYRAQISIAASLALHILAFLIFAGVKLYRAEDIQDSMPVTFVNAQKTIPLRRSSPVRHKMSVIRSKRNYPPEQFTIHPGDRSSVEFYYSPSEKVFSEVKSLKQGVFQDSEIQRPFAKREGSLFDPVSVKLLNDPHLRAAKIQPRISEGRDLLGDIKLPEFDTLPAEDVLQKFLSTVRKRIESEKKYPIAAQKAEIEGYTTVKMTILKDGRLEKAEITKSSGHEILDNAALQSVRNAEPFPPIPEEAKLGNVEVSIRLVFTLSQGG